MKKDHPYHRLWRQASVAVLMLWSCLKVKRGKSKSEYGVKPRSLWRSQPESHHLYPAHLDWLKYLTSDGKGLVRAKRSSGLGEQRENSAASARVGLKMVEAGNRGSQCTTTKGAQGHTNTSELSVSSKCILVAHDRLLAPQHSHHSWKQWEQKGRKKTCWEIIVSVSTRCTLHFKRLTGDSTRKIGVCD